MAERCVIVGNVWDLGGALGGGSVDTHTERCHTKKTDHIDSLPHFKTKVFIH